MHCIFPLGALLMFINTANAQPEIFAEALRFKTQDKTPYIEFHYRVPAQSVEFVELSSGKFQAKLLITLQMMAGKDIAYLDKYELLSPEQQFAGGAHSLIDIKRLPLKYENLSLKLTVKDLVSGKRNSYSTQINSPGKAKKLLSSIFLVESYTPLEKPTSATKGGMLLIPRLYPSYKEEEDFVTFYAEYYGDDEKLSLTVFNEGHEMVMQKPLACTNYGKVKFVLFTLPLSGYSGDYELSISAAAKDTLQWSSKKIRVLNPNDQNIFTQDYRYKSLLIFSDYLYPIAQGPAWDRLDSVIKAKDSNQLKVEFYQFWAAQMPDDPELAWKRYLDLVVKANKNFTQAGREGYQTDRGRIFLKYGPPNDITTFHNEMDTYPYEIWDYYNLGAIGNAQFILANLSFTGNNFSLIHSSAQGEPKNPEWKKRIARGGQKYRGGGGY